MPVKEAKKKKESEAHTLLSNEKNGQIFTYHILNSFSLYTVQFIQHIVYDVYDVYV